MSENMQALVGVIVVIAVLSALLVAWRAESMAQPGDLEKRGLGAVRRDAVLFYGIALPVVVGVITYYVYRWMNGRWPDDAQTYILLLAVAIAVIFTAMAAAVFKMRGFAEFVILHVLYVIGFGAVLPRLLFK